MNYSREEEPLRSMGKRLNLIYPFYIVLIILFVFAAEASSQKHKAEFNKEYIFPFQDKHVHGSSIVELPNGDLLSSWFEGSGERNANDVMIKGARLKKGAKEWSKTFVLADTPGHPDCNPVLFMNSNNRLFLIWIVVQANRWETSVLKYRYSDEYSGDGAPDWKWQDVILLKPDDKFVESVKEGFKVSGKSGLSWAEYAPRYEDMVYEAAKDQKKRETGWMTRIKPTILSTGRIILPLYSDGYNFSLMAISDDDGINWSASLPSVGRGNVQPVIIEKEDGSLIAYMRDNGDEPGRIMVSSSDDKGYTWSPAEKLELPNPGSSIDAIKLKNGHFLMVYNDVEDGRYSLVASISEDEGKTWEYTRSIEKAERGEGSFAYPTVIQSKDGKVHATFSYSVGGDKTIEYVLFTEEWVRGK